MAVEPLIHRGFLVTSVALRRINRKSEASSGQGLVGSNQQTASRAFVITHLVTFHLVRAKPHECVQHLAGANYRPASTSAGRVIGVDLLMAFS